MNPPPITDRLPISIRAYAVPDAIGNDPIKKRLSRSTALAASGWALIFDCETFADETQALRFGTYQIRHHGALMESGIFYSPENLTAAEIAVLRKYASAHRLELLTHTEFVDDVFFRIGYDYRATIVGFNLPFDIARIAINADSARGRMKGGFTFGLTENKKRPRIQIKHLSAKAAFIQFAAPGKNRSNRSVLKLGKSEPIQRGHFVDCKTLSNALLAKSFSLATLCDALGVKNAKLKKVDFAAPIRPKFVEYAVRDTQATWECYSALIDKFEKLGLDGSRPEKIYSEASLGKACLKTMGIKPWQECQPDFDPELIGAIMSSYYGGRTEIGIRREQRQVMLCDFLSMYPTVGTLMQLWRFVIATGIKSSDATKRAQSILESVTLADLGSPRIWPSLVMLVRIKPDAEIVPVRAHYADAQQATIGLNYYTSDSPQWFTLADCIASKLHTGKAAEIVEAIAFSPLRKQRGLRPFEINGDAEYAIDPAKDDFYKRLIELRQATKNKRKGASAALSDTLDTKQNSLKIMANATSYGIFVELNVEDAMAGSIAELYAGHDDSFAVRPSKVEKPGTYFHPLLATLITGAARLMLAITEKLAIDRGLDWSFCDTDSFALAKPELMKAPEFVGCVQSVIEWFSHLNPYAFEGSILKSEDVNFALSDRDRLETLYCFAVSAKRYALYNLDTNGRPIIRKASAHGLGHLRAPYDETNPAPSIPAPQIDLAKAGLALWQHDLWFKIIEASHSDKPRMVDLSYHPALQLPAISRYTATSPDLLRWFKQHNEGKSYNEQVKPFGFLTGLMADNLDFEARIVNGAASRSVSNSGLKPISPYETDPAKAAQNAFDRNTGEPVPIAKLKSFAQAIGRYHLQPENKFLNGDYVDSGKTRRRHVFATCTSHIGKEANELERQANMGFDPDAQPSYGYSPHDIAKLQLELARLCEVFSTYEIALHGRMKAKRLTDFIDADSNSNRAAIGAETMEALVRHFAAREVKERTELAALNQLVMQSGLRKTAQELQIDPSNLRRKLARSQASI
jgi:hypothetical protein